MLAYLNRMNWAELEALSDTVVYVLPISSLEQHGHHLPLGTDDFLLNIAVEALFNKASGRFKSNFLFLPALHYGNSHEHLDFPGTISLEVDTIRRIIEDILSTMKRHSIKHLLILNAHGGNTPIFSAYGQEWAQKYDVLIYNVNFFASSFFDDAANIIETPLSLDIHGGELETSILQCAMPEVVNSASLNKEQDVYSPIADYSIGWLSSKLSPGDGRLGASSKATQEKGAQLIAYIANKLIHYFEMLDNEIQA